MSSSKAASSLQSDKWFSESPVALLAVQEQSLRCVAANKRAVAMLSIPDGSATSQQLAGILSPETIDRVLALGESGDLQGCQVREGPGKLRECDLSVTRLPGESLILISLLDASVRLKLAEQLRQAQKMEALGMLAGGIAHDFNNLLTIISGYSQMLLVSPQLSAQKDRTALEQVLKASERAADLTTQLLAFSRRQSIQPRVLDLNNVVDQTATMLRRLIGEDIELRISKSPDAGRVHADLGQLQQTLLNLAINARDAMPNGGRLEIRTGCADLGADYVGQHLGVKPGHYALVSVVDNGTGMDEATRKRMFEPFFTTKEQGKGTGLGLSTVYGIVRQSGGSIDIYTEPGHGTTFCVYLPAVEDAAVEDAEADTESRGGHETVLLVEDEEAVRRMLHAALERKGYRVLVASGAAEALNAAAQWDGPLDLLITDVIMPEMNGRDLAEKLMTARPAITVLFISGYAGNALLDAGNLGSESTFMQKPFTPATLTATVRDLLDAKRGDTESASS